MDTTNTTGKAGSPITPPVPASAPRDLAFKSPPTPSAVASVPAFGGNRGGKPREDGLVPGSSEAAQADKDKDARRKRDDRAAKNKNNPPALPSALPPVLNSTIAPAAGASPGTPGPAPLQSDAVPWDPAAIRPLLEEIINGTEQSRIQDRRSKAAAVGLPDKVVKEVASLASYPDAAKRALALSGSSATAKAMNSLGISGKYSDAAIASTALIAIMVSNRRSDEKFEEMIAEFKKGQAPKPATAKP